MIVDLSGIDLTPVQTARGWPDLTREQWKELDTWSKFYSSVKIKYGIGEREYVALWISQGGRCFICRKAVGLDPRFPLQYLNRKTRPRRLGVDHNHLTGEVRGLLCAGSYSADTCNRLIGRYSLEAIQRAAQYMIEPPARTVLASLRES